MLALLEAESTLTARYQTTVPEPVRRALRLRKSDKLHYTLRETGEIVISRVTPEQESDPALEAFLSFLAQDIQQHPEQLQPASKTQRQAIRKLTRGVKFDLNETLPSDGE